MDILKFINKYNCYICGVNMADQLKSYYNTQRIHLKMWRPLFSFLLDIIISNCYKLSTYKPSNGAHGLRKDTHLQFCHDLSDALLKASTQPNQRRGKISNRKGTADIIWRPVKEHKLVHLWLRKSLQNCSPCIEAGRVSKKRVNSRKPLTDLSQNTTRTSRNDSVGWKRPTRAPRTNYGCSICRIPFCTSGECWNTHLAKLNTKD